MCVVLLDVVLHVALPVDGEVDDTVQSMTRNMRKHLDETAGDLGSSITFFVLLLCGGGGRTMMWFPCLVIAFGLRRVMTVTPTPSVSMLKILRNHRQRHCVSLKKKKRSSSCIVHYLISLSKPSSQRLKYRVVSCLSSRWRQKSKSSYRVS